MSKPVVIASLEFPTKKSAKEFFRKIRDRHQNGERVVPEDDRYLHDLIAIHPEAETKIGCGISHFTVEREEKFGTRHFAIHRVDGTITDVSFNSAIDGRNERRDRLEALRRSIEDQIFAFKASSFTSREALICPLRRIPITEDSYHIDHEPPKTFMCLVDEWIEIEEIKLIDLKITPPFDNQIVTEMTDKKQLLSWQAFHRKNAKLRLLSPIGNLSSSKLENAKRSPKPANQNFYRQ